LKRVYTLIIALLIICFVSNGQDNIVPFDRTTFYAVMASSNLSSIDGMISKIDKLQFGYKDAFLGTLLMKKAGLITGVSIKISTFKDGRSRLEKEIKKSPTNGEFRFLRLMIQENAPSILNYADQKNEDKQAILKAYNSFSTSLKKIIVDYSKHSKILSRTDF
jgi:hypothetical protein